MNIIESCLSDLNNICYRQVTKVSNDTEQLDKANKIYDYITRALPYFICKSRSKT